MKRFSNVSGTFQQRSKVPLVLASLAAALFGGLYAAAAAGYRVNMTTCEPLGLYKTQPFAGPTHVGQLVTLCPPNNRYIRAAVSGGWLNVTPGSLCVGHVTPFLKTVAAVAGQTVRVAAGGVWVDGKRLPNSRVLPRTPEGQTVPHIPYGTYIVPAGTIWEYAPGNDAYDSRYYGPVPIKNIISTATPVWVDRAAEHWLKVNTHG